MPRSVPKWHTEGHGKGMVGVWRGQGGGIGGGRAGAGWLRESPPVCHFGTQPPSCFKCQPVIATPKNPSRHSSQKNAVESTQGRSAAKPQPNPPRRGPRPRNRRREIENEDDDEHGILRRLRVNQAIADRKS